jgi:protein SCO1/2
MKLFQPTPSRKIAALCASVLACFAAAAGVGRAQVDYTKGIDFAQNLGAQVPLDTSLRDESGKTIRLGDVFQGRPVILVPIAFRCQTACAMVTDGLLKTLTAMTRIPRARIGESHNAIVGKDFDVVFISIDPLDDDPAAVKKGTPVALGEDGTAQLPNDGHVALAKKDLILNSYEQPSSEHGWHLLTGTLENVHRVTDAIGLQYYFSPKTDVIRNPTGIVFLTPSGKISSYILGTDYATSVLTDDVKIASREEIGTKTDKIMFVCFTPDPSVAHNRVVIESIIRWTCLTFLVAVIAFIVKLSLPDWRKPVGGGNTLSPR